MVCVNAGQYEGVDLDLAKIYEALPTDKIDRDNGFLRVIDNSGEDYLFPSKWFIEVKVPKLAKEAILRAR